MVKLGHFLKGMASRRRASDAILRLTERQPQKATRRRVGVRGGVPYVEETVIPIADVRPGDIIVVNPGEIVPVDGTVSMGQSTVDESLLTGEPSPVLKQRDDPVWAGTKNQDGSFHIRTEKLGADTRLSARIRELQDSGK